MSLNLLAAYGSDSEEDKHNDEEFGDVDIQQDEEVQKEKEAEDAGSSDTMNVGDMQKSLFSSDFASSSSDEDDDGGPGSEDVVSRLPSARSVLTGTTKLESSLFISEAEKEQDERNAILSQHVAVSEQAKKSERSLRGKRKAQPCRAFMRGSCTRGASCRFSHVVVEKPEFDPLSATIEGKAEYYKDANEAFTVKKAKKS